MVPKHILKQISKTVLQRTPNCLLNTYTQASFTYMEAEKKIQMVAISMINMIKIEHLL